MEHGNKKIYLYFFENYSFGMKTFNYFALCFRFQQEYALAIFFTAMSTYLSWPFAAILGVPIAADILFRKQKWTFFIKWSVISTITILIPQILIDSYYYGKTTFASFNIVKYNVLTGKYT